jgi:hypothetical protein
MHPYGTAIPAMLASEFMKDAVMRRAQSTICRSATHYGVDPAGLADALRARYQMSRKGICIFCANHRKMSKEHVFPSWLKEHFPRGLNDTHGAYAMSLNTQANAYTKIFEKKHGGSSTTITVRVVCRECNNEWMSKLEQAVRPILSPLIRGEEIILTQDQQRVLATWIVKTAMTAEYRYPEAIAVPQTQRQALMSNEEPPDGWLVGIAHYKGRKWRDAVLYRQMIGISPIDKLDEPHNGRDFVQTTCFGLGDLFVQTMCLPYSIDDEPPIDETQKPMRQLWPVANRTLVWPPPMHLDDKTATETVTSMVRALGLNAPSL